MIVFNRQKAKDILAKPKPVVKAVIIKPVQVIVSSPPARRVPEEKKQKSALSEQCWNEYNALRVEQAKVANEVHKLVATDAAQHAFADLYRRVESFRPELVTLYKRARHAEQYGKLPEDLHSHVERTDALTLKDRKRRLSDERSKLKNKITLGEATNAKKLVEWKLRLEQATAEYDQVDFELKKLAGK